jgi:hypothetical protein
LLKLTTDRPYADPGAAARKLLEIANATEAVQEGRIHIEKINGPMLFVVGILDRYQDSAGYGGTGRVSGIQLLPRSNNPANVIAIAIHQSTRNHLLAQR